MGLNFKRFTMRHWGDWLINTSLGRGNVFRADLTTFLPDLPTPHSPTLVFSSFPLLASVLIRFETEDNKGNKGITLVFKLLFGSELCSPVGSPIVLRWQ